MTLPMIWQMGQWFDPSAIPSIGKTARHTVTVSNGTVSGSNSGASTVVSVKEAK